MSAYPQGSGARLLVQFTRCCGILHANLPAELKSRSLVLLASRDPASPLPVKPVLLSHPCSPPIRQRGCEEKTQWMTRMNWLFALVNFPQRLATRTCMILRWDFLIMHVRLHALSSLFSTMLTTPLASWPDLRLNRLPCRSAAAIGRHRPKGETEGRERYCITNSPPMPSRVQLHIRQKDAGDSGLTEPPFVAMITGRLHDFPNTWSPGRKQ